MTVVGAHVVNALLYALYMVVGLFVNAVIQEHIAKYTEVFAVRVENGEQDVKNMVEVSFVSVTRGENDVLFMVGLSCARVEK